jgi:WhiB family redox-sensing transcriptional regulator
MTGRVNWREDAACRNAAPELFFQISTARAALLQIGQSKRICQTCPVQTQCLAWALRHQVAHGVWAAPPKTSGAHFCAPAL